MIVPSAEQIRQRLERLQTQPSARDETAFYANADKDIAYLLALLDTLSQELERLKHESVKHTVESLALINEHHAALTALREEREQLKRTNESLLTRRVIEGDSPRQPAAPTDGGLAWQPIETAPKDGTRVWLWNGYRRTIGWHAHYEDESSGWHRQSLIREGLGKRDIDPETHWMPLPVPPSEEPPSADARLTQTDKGKASGSATDRDLRDLRTQIAHLTEERDNAWGELGFTKNDLRSALYRAEQAEAKVAGSEPAASMDARTLLTWAEAHVSALRGRFGEREPWHILRAEMIRDGLARVVVVDEASSSDARILKPDGSPASGSATDRDLRDLRTEIAEEREGLRKEAAGNRNEADQWAEEHAKWRKRANEAETASSLYESIADNWKGEAEQLAGQLAALTEVHERLREASQSAIAFLDTIEWNDNTSAMGSEDVTNQLHDALLSPREGTPTPDRTDYISWQCSECLNDCVNEGQACPCGAKGPRAE